MNMREWARKEVEIACKRENPERKQGEFDYGCACYDSALKAFESLMNDGHSGMSIGFTKKILNRLIDGKPLTSIEDTDDIWNECSYDEEFKQYQCKRMGALFKMVYYDGSVKYRNVDRFVGVDINNTTCAYHNGFVYKIAEETFGPITMPYIPEDKPYYIYTEDFLVDPRNDDYDTRAILHAVTPFGEKVQINRYFKENRDSFVEIGEREYLDRKKIAEERACIN